MRVSGNFDIESAVSNENEVFSPPSRYFQDNISDLSLEEIQILVNLLDKYYLKSELLQQQKAHIQNQYQLAQHKYIDLLYFSPIGYLISDRHGQILEANLTATYTLGFSSSIIMGKRLDHFVNESDVIVLNAHFDSLFQGKRRNMCEVTLQKEMGVAKHLRLESMLWPDRHGEMSLCLTAVIDITVQKAFNQHLNQKSRIDALESVIGHIAHDFNNVLHSIMSNAEYLVQDVSQIKDPHIEETNKRLKRILDLSSRASDSINRLLELGTDATIVPKDVQAHTFFTAHQAEFEKFIPRKINVEWRLEESDFTIKVAPEQLRLMVINLMVDAINELPNGGYLVVEFVKQLPSKQVQGLGASEFLYWHVMKISHSSARFMPRLPIETTLSSLEDAVMKFPQVSGIIRQYGGMVRTIVEQDSRATCLYFPVLDKDGADMETAVSKPAPPPKPWVNGQGLTILLVEDDSEVAESLREILEYFGFAVMMAIHGKEGLETYQVNHHQIDLIITDLVMPEMDGELFLHAVKAFDPHAKVIAISGYPLSIKINDLYQKGIFGFVQKPFTIQKISQVLQQALDA